MTVIGPSRDKKACPLCRAPVGAGDLIDPLPPPPPPPVKDEAAAGGASDAGDADGALVVGSVEEAAQGSSKVLLLLERLRALPAGGKAVVFSQVRRRAVCLYPCVKEGGLTADFSQSTTMYISPPPQFLGMMDIVSSALATAAIPFVRLDGKSSAAQRAQMLAAFASADAASPRVFLASLKAGGVGLNLTAASEVHVLDPHWNPAVEDQAADRVHRLGQTRPVTVSLDFRGAVEGGGCSQPCMRDLHPRPSPLTISNSTPFTAKPRPSTTPPDLPVRRPGDHRGADAGPAGARRRSTGPPAARVPCGSRRCLPATRHRNRSFSTTPTPPLFAPSKPKPTNSGAQARARPSGV
jgi:hypothetical protein